MLKGLKGLLIKTPRNDSAKRPAPKVAAKPVAVGKDYGAALVVPGTRCCVGAKSAARERFLFRDAPRLPLADCTMPGACACRFKKASDRRDTDADRRDIGLSETGRWYAGPNHRISRRRKPAKG